MSLEFVVDRWAQPGPEPDWIREHGDDEIPVKLIDLLCLVARLEDIARKPDPLTEHRLVTCDLVRMKAYLPPEALEELG